MSKYDENGQLKCLTEPCENCHKLRKKNNVLRKKYNYEKRWAHALIAAHFGDVTPAQEKEFGFLLSKL